MKLILQFLKPYRLTLFLAILVMVLDVSGGLLIPTITADIINNGVGGGNMEYVVRKGLLMAAVSLLAGCGALCGSYLCARLSAGLGRDLRNAIYDKSLQFSASDMEKIGTGSMITRTLSDVNVVQQSVVMAVQMVLPVPVVCILGILMAFRIDAQMGALIAGVTLFILLTAALIIRKAGPLFDRLQQLLDRMNVVIRENITGVRVIRAFNKEGYEETRMQSVFGRYRDISVTVCRLFAGMESTALLVVNLVIVAVLYLGGNRTGAGYMQIGGITALSQYAVLILFYLLMAQFVLLYLPRAAVCVRRIGEVLSLSPEICDPKEPAPIGAGSDAVVAFQNVSFRFHDADEDTLHALSFSLKRGQTTAVIGSTGSGKSTVAKLILRFHDVTEGKVLFEGTDIRRLSQASLRERIAYVPQKAWLFSGTIADNLRHGRADAREEEIAHALSVSEADFVTALPGGIRESVSQGGTNFSGGQKQRLSIARALMKKADLYIFDDSFSALDFKTDAALRKKLSQRTQDAAVLIIAQRISTIRNADQIIVLEDGRVAGIGTHAALMESCRVYREIADSQMRSSAEAPACCKEYEKNGKGGQTNGS